MTAPANLRVIGVTRFSVYLQWDPSVDNVGLESYDVYINGAKTFSTDNTSFLATGLDSFQNYNFTVRARDAVGNLSPFSNQVTAFTKLQGRSTSIMKVIGKVYRTLIPFQSLKQA